ncbi:hypothetical protein [Brevundimonas sp. AAP58]|nr:hypothetical protein [Brevundimonas sp. AAP58]
MTRDSRRNTVIGESAPDAPHFRAQSSFFDGDHRQSRSGSEAPRAER